MNNHRGEGEFIDVRLKRLPGCDDLPLTQANAKAAGFEYTEEDGSAYPEYYPWLEECNCPICKAAK